MDIGTIMQELAMPMITGVVYCICYAIKKGTFINDKYIPLIAIILGAISGLVVKGLSYEAIASGIFSGAAATWANQVYKQLTDDRWYK